MTGESTCHECGSETRTSWRFCPWCGFKQLNEAQRNQRAEALRQDEEDERMLAEVSQ